MSWITTWWTGIPYPPPIPTVLEFVPCMFARPTKIELDKTLLCSIFIATKGRPPVPPPLPSIPNYPPLFYYLKVYWLDLQCGKAKLTSPLLPSRFLPSQVPSFIPTINDLLSVTLTPPSQTEDLQWWASVTVEMIDNIRSGLKHIETTQHGDFPIEDGVLGELMEHFKRKRD